MDERLANAAEQAGTEKKKREIRKKRVWDERACRKKRLMTSEAEENKNKTKEERRERK